MYVTPLNRTLKGLIFYVIPFYHSLKNGKTGALQDSKDRPHWTRPSKHPLPVCAVLTATPGWLRGLSVDGGVQQETSGHGHAFFCIFHSIATMETLESWLTIKASNCPGEKQPEGLSRRLPKERVPLLDRVPAAVFAGNAD